MQLLGDDMGGLPSHVAVSSRQVLLGLNARYTTVNVCKLCWASLTL